MQHVVETPEQRMIQDLRMVRRRNDQAVRAVVLDHLEKAVQDPPYLAHVVREPPLRPDRVELVKEIDASRVIRGVEDLA